jgi:hypothetical protein
MKKIFLSLVLMASAVAAFAVPNPKAIEAQMQAGNYAQARSMVNEVLKEKPDSARAHLLNAYTILQLERNVTLAEQELQAAARYDKKGDVVGSNLYRKTQNEIASAKQAAAPPAYVAPPVIVATAAPQYQAPAPVQYEPAVVKKEEGSGWFTKFIVFLLLISGAGFAYAYFKKKKEEEVVAEYKPVVTPTAKAATEVPVPSAYASPRRTYSPPAAAYVPPPAAPTTVVHTGPSALETGVAVAGGVVAGAVIADAIRGSSHRHHDDHASYRPSAPAYVPPPYVPPAPALAPSTFSSGRNDTWDEPVAAPAVNVFSSSRNDDEPASNSFSSSREEDPPTSSSSSSDDDNNW